MSNEYSHAGRVAGRGFTLLELVVVIAIISLLAVFAIERLLRLQVEAERVAVQQVIGILQSALAMEIAAHVVRDDIPGLDRLVGSNPMDRLSEYPHNYLGEKAGARPEQLANRQWYYDLDERALVYLVKNTEHFSTPLEAPKRLRLRIVPVYDDVNRNRRYDPGIDQLKGLRLQALEPFRWTSEPIEARDFIEQQVNGA